MENEGTTQKVAVKIPAKSLQNVCKVCGKPLTRGEIGDTCLSHEGKLRQNADVREAVPENWVRMSKVCDAAVEQGLTINQIVKASGGDAATKPVLDPIFKVVYVGRGKWMNPEVLTKGFALLKQHNAELGDGKKKELPAPEQKMEIADSLRKTFTKS